MNKYRYLHVLQGDYGHHGWADLTESENRQEVSQDYKDHKANESIPLRIIERREVVTTGAGEPGAYPSQYEAEAVLETMDALEGIFFGGCGDDCATRKIVQTAINDTLVEFQRIFNDPENSPWIVRTTEKTRRRSVVWNPDFKSN